MDLPMVDEIDHKILMHRDAHFSGSFPLMIEYYKKKGKGVDRDLTIKRILELAELEEKLKENLSRLYLSHMEKKEVERARKKYLELRDVYESGSKSAQIISDLILTEKEDPFDEIEAAVSMSQETLPALLELVSSNDFYSPLFPGYGTAPYAAATALGQIQAPLALNPLFEALGRDDFFLEEIVLAALKEIPGAKEFLLKKLSHLPISKDNEKAVIALLQFTEESSIATECLNLLKNQEVWKLPLFASYLILGCSALDLSERKVFLTLLSQDNLPEELKKEMVLISKSWR